MKINVKSNDSCNKANVKSQKLNLNKYNSSDSANPLLGSLVVAIAFCFVIYYWLFSSVLINFVISFIKL